MEIIRGKQQKAQRVVVYGPEGIGKSSFAAKFPNPLFVDVENGTAQLDVTRTARPVARSWNTTRPAFINCRTRSGLRRCLTTYRSNTIMNYAERLYEEREDRAEQYEAQQMAAKDFAEAFMENELGDALDVYSHAFGEHGPDEDAVEEAHRMIDDAFSKRFLLDVDPVTHRPIFMTKTNALRRLAYLLSGVYLSEKDRELVKAAMRL